MNRAPLRILVAEDSHDDYLLIQHAMEDAGLTNPHDRVKDGSALLAFLRDTSNPKPDIILLDLNMMPMSGLEALDHLRVDAALSAIPVAVLTTSTVDKEICERKGVKHYYVKPVDPEGFMAILVEVLNVKVVVS